MQIVAAIHTEPSPRPHLAGHKLGHAVKALQSFHTAGTGTRAASTGHAAPEAGVWRRQRGGSEGKKGLGRGVATELAGTVYFLY